MLLQETRTKQALKEIGNENAKIKIVHAERPKTIVNGKEYTLIFPKFIANAGNSFQRFDRIFFKGFMTVKRAEFLARLFFYKKPLLVINSENGRDEVKKKNDWEYFEQMGESQFVACPDGDFTWTYRFFEAIFCQAIPIIENESPLYKGYKFYKVGEELVYNTEWVEHNLAKAKKELMLC